jgi:hypothetical protein
MCPDKGSCMWSDRPFRLRPLVGFESGGHPNLTVVKKVATLVILSKGSP